MSDLFFSVLNMSLTGSYVILFVIFIRLLLKKAPKVISYALWAVVAFRLIIPFSFESMFSLMPWNAKAVPIPHDIIYQQSSQINSGIEAVDSFVSQLIPKSATGASINPLKFYAEIGTYIWVFGIVVILAYSYISILILKRQLKSAELVENNILEAKNLKTPFVLGLIKPKIYLPAGLNDEERNYILLHEQTHIQRKDNVIKILSFFILAIYWFNPLVWVAFILMGRDMELSCDERVLKKMNEDNKKTYANLLLSLATGSHILNATPLAFSEGNVKRRIKNVLNYKKPSFMVIFFSIIITIAIGIGLITNPINTTKISDTRDILEISEKWAEELKNRDGKARYELMSPESKADYYNSLVDINGEEYPWVIGCSSPYVVSYEIKASGTSAVITYITETSEPKEYIYQEQLFFDNQGGKTFVNKCNVIVSYLRKDLYEEAIKIQKQVEEGHQTWHLSSESVVLEFVHRDLGVEGGEIISSSSNNVVFKKTNGEEIKIKLYRPININNGFLAIYEYSIGTTHYILDDNYLAPQTFSN
ncbi:M56 family metallopeptidase [Clostridium sp. 'deep sea']|uniref:M56 family metallopeptidase n=1 Tax=Clostridium sp. 'deep sea' TaxID=2779445 RepID=UPI00189658D7|nr:M56 family metallopeptidase [Clostridium sp. 'deep sea']QOR34847.1 M56 family metallopeptidase [Clostridium sp. 'deep sea']